MVETVLALPVVLVMLVAIIGFGVAAKRLSPLQNAARYDTWHGAAPGAPGPNTEATLSAAFYPKDTPASLVRSDGDDALSDRVQTPLTSALSGDASSLANSAFGHFPAGRAGTVAVAHNSGIPLLGALGFTAEVKRGAATLDGDWRFAGGISYLGQPWAGYPDGWNPSVASRDGNARLAQDVRTLFLSSLDGQLPTDNNTVGQAIRDLYTWYPGYCGPNWILNPAAFPPGQAP